MPTDTMPLFRQIAAAAIKTAVAVIALVVVYPYAVTALARLLNLGR